MVEYQKRGRATGPTIDMVRARKSSPSFTAAERIFAAQVDEVVGHRSLRRPQSSARHSYSGTYDFRLLPPLTNEGLTDIERKELLTQKFIQCTMIFDFQNPSENTEGKNAKKDTLAEILDYMSERTGVITPDMYKPLFAMVSANLFRTIPPQINAFGDPFDPEEDEPREEPAWLHLCLVYHIFLRFLESSDFNNNAARPHIDQAFTMQLLELFDCEDVRERESLKTVLHRIYGKMLGMRSFIRRSINNIFLQFIYETQRHNGIAELLEILGSIINGFTVPLKDEHVSFLHRVLLPLHKARPMTLYYAQLAYCTVQFLEKDPTLAETIIKSLLRYWPKVNSPKEVMFVNELEGIMDVIEPAQFTSICQPLFQQLVKCIVSPHFQIAERTLGMWRNNYFVNLITDNIHLILPIALSGIYRHSRSHWNRNIHNQVYQILRFFVNVNEDLFEQCLSDFRHQRDQERKRARKNVNWWTAVEKIAMEKKAESNPTSPTNAFALNADASLKQPLTSPAPLANPTANPTASPTIPVAATTDSMDSGAVSPAGDSNKDVTPVGSVPPATSESENKAAAEEPDRWGLLPSEMPMSKLDDPETMNIEMEEDEFIRELDKFVDIIKAEDPDSSMTNGMMMLDESDGSGIVDEVLGAAGQNVYSYSQQMQIQQQHYEQQQQQHQHAAMLHNMANGSDQMNGHIIMDPTSMHVDYASSIMASTEAANPIAPTPLQSNAFPSEAYLQHQQQHYVGHDGSIHGGIDVSPNNIQMTSSIALHQGISNVSMSDDSSSASSLSPVAIVSPIPGGGSSGSPVQEPTDETRHDAPPVSTGAMDLSSTPPPQHFA